MSLIIRVHHLIMKQKFGCFTLFCCLGHTLILWQNILFCFVSLVEQKKLDGRDTVYQWSQDVYHDKATHDICLERQMPTFNYYT